MSAPARAAELATQAITAVVVTRGRSTWLPRCLVSLAEQTRPPDQIVLVDAGGGGDPALIQMAERCGIDRQRLAAVPAPSARTFGAAVAAGLRAVPSAGHDLIWLIHDDSYPEPTCLELLTRAIEQAPSVVIAGPKQRRADQPGALGQVGVTTSRFGRRMTGAEDGELDQGQYDHRDDVLGVGTVGLLIRRQAWDQLGGCDPGLGPFRDGLDLSRRARLAGHRVVVVPAAVVGHEQASFRGLRTGRTGSPAPQPDTRRSFRARRRAFLYTQLTQAPLPLIPLIVMAAIVAGLGRAIWRIMTKDFDLAPAELLAVTGVLVHPGLIARSRRRQSATRRLPRSTLRPLQVSQRDVRAMHRDRRLARAEARRLAVAPGQAEVAARADAARRRRTALTILILATVAISVAALAPLIGSGWPSGGALRPISSSLSRLWDQALGSWLTVGLGQAGPADPFNLVLAVWTSLFAGNGALALTVLLVGAPPLAGLGAWFAAGAASRSPRVRLWAGLIWFAAPSLWLSLASGRIGAVVTHLALPWLALSLARAFGVDRRDRFGPSQAQDKFGRPAPALGVPSLTAAGLAGLLLAVAAAGTPVLLGPGLVGLVVLFVAVRPRWRIGLIVLPALATFAPLALAAARSGNWRLLLADPGMPTPFEPVSLWRQLAGWPGRSVLPDLPWWWADDVVVGRVLAASGGVVVGLALVALLRRGVRGRAVRIGWIVAIAALAGSGLFGRIDVALGQAGLVRPWPGGLVSLVQLGLLAAAVIGTDGLGAAIGRHRPVLAAAWVAGVLAVLVPIGLGGLYTWQWRVAPEAPAVQRQTSAELPAIVALAGASAYPASTLVLDPESDGIGWQVVRGHGVEQTDTAAVIATERLNGLWLEGTSLLTQVALADDANTAMGEIVARLAAGSAENLADDLVIVGIGYIAVARAEAPGLVDLIAALDARTGLVRISETDQTILWRVGEADGAAGQAAGPARLHVIGPDGTLQTGLPSSTGTAITTELPTGTGPRQLVLAERASPSWEAKLNGVPLAPTSYGWLQAFELGNDGGRLVIGYVPTDRWLRVVQGAVAVLVVLVALPLRRTGSQEH